MAISLAEKLGKRGLQAYSLHPGVSLNTNITNHLDWVSEGEGISKFIANFYSLTFICDSCLTFAVAVEVSMGNKYMNMGAYPQNDDDEIIATHIYAAFSDDLKGNRIALDHLYIYSRN